MTWRGSTDAKDRFFAALLYVLPLIDALPFSQFIFQQFPQLAFIYLPLKPLIAFYYGFPFAGFIIFLLLFMAVVRNERISHFIRFNAMQTILIGILLILLQLALGVLLRGLGAGLPIVIETLYNVVFLGTLAACFYSIIQSALGRYAEIPTISDAAYTQIPR
jgi:uncharacterized membrane protein